MSYGYNDDQDMLNADNKGVEEARGHLSKMWRTLLVARDIDGWKWDRLMRIYLTDPRNGIQNNSRDRSSARGNLNKELKRDDMTWRVFEKALKFLDPIRIVFTVRVTFKDGKTVEVSSMPRDRGKMPEFEQSAPEVDEILDNSGDGDLVPEHSMATEHRPDFRNRPSQDVLTPQGVIDAINRKKKK